jgi:hypothetical protein
MENQITNGLRPDDGRKEETRGRKGMMSSTYLHLKDLITNNTEVPLTIYKIYQVPANEKIDSARYQLYTDKGVLSIWEGTVMYDQIAKVGMDNIKGELTIKSVESKNGFKYGVLVE